MNQGRILEIVDAFVKLNYLPSLEKVYLNTERIAKPSSEADGRAFKKAFEHSNLPADILNPVFRELIHMKMHFPKKFADELFAPTLERNQSQFTQRYEKLVSEMMTAEISSILEPLRSEQYKQQEVEKIFQAAYDFIVAVTRYFTPNPSSGSGGGGGGARGPWAPPLSQIRTISYAPPGTF